MPANSAWLIADSGGATRTLEEVFDNLDKADGDVVLDFSAVHRLDTKALDIMHRLAGKAGEKAIKVELRGVNVEIYKVFKLVKLAPRFTFLI